MVVVVVLVVLVVVEEGVRHRLTELLLRCVSLRPFVPQGGRLGSLYHNTTRNTTRKKMEGAQSVDEVRMKTPDDGWHCHC